MSLGTLRRNCAGNQVDTYGGISISDTFMTALVLYKYIYICQWNLALESYGALDTKLNCVLTISTSPSRIWQAFGSERRSFRSVFLILGFTFRTGYILFSRSL